MSQPIFRRTFIALTALVSATTSLSGQQPQARERVQTLRFNLRPKGLVPASMTVPEGKYRFELRNGYILAPLELEFEDNRSVRVAELRARNGAPISRFEANLREGTHRLAVRGRPQWSAEIVVTKR